MRKTFVKILKFSNETFAYKPKSNVPIKRMKYQNSIMKASQTIVNLKYGKLS